jgi:hypothetical protein
MTRIIGILTSTSYAYLLEEATRRYRDPFSSPRASESGCLLVCAALRLLRMYSCERAVCEEVIESHCMTVPASWVV